MQLLLERPLSHYYLLLRAGKPGASQAAQTGQDTCSLTAELYDEQSSDLTQCDGSTLTVRSHGGSSSGSGATHETWLRLQSSCQSVSAALKVRPI